MNTMSRRVRVLPIRGASSASKANKQRTARRLIMPYDIVHIRGIHALQLALQLLALPRTFHLWESFPSCKARAFLTERKAWVLFPLPNFSTGHKVPSYLPGQPCFFPGVGMSILQCSTINCSAEASTRVAPWRAAALRDPRNLLRASVRLPSIPAKNNSKQNEKLVQNGVLLTQLEEEDYRR